MKTLLALLLSTTPSCAMFCVQGTNEEVLAHLEKNAHEIVHFVGALGDDKTNIPMEITVSEDGTWTMLAITNQGVCLTESGVNWQPVEQKPPGVEN